MLFWHVARKKITVENADSIRTHVKRGLVEEATALPWYYSTLYHITECGAKPDTTHMGVWQMGVVLGKLKSSKHEGKYLETLKDIRWA